MFKMISPSSIAARAVAEFLFWDFMQTTLMNGNRPAIRRRRVRRVGLTILAEMRLRDALRARSPSEPWVDAQFNIIADTDERGNEVIRRTHDPEVFPPGGPETAMVRCPVCGIFTPPGGMENGVCLDHCEHDHWGPSPSAQSIWMLQCRQGRSQDLELAPESTFALLGEIFRHQTGRLPRRRKNVANPKKKKPKTLASRSKDR